jgi:hypothetical protein
VHVDERALTSVDAMVADNIGAGMILCDGDMCDTRGVALSPS